MNINDICSRNVYCVYPSQALAEAAREMNRRGIGTAVVVEARGDKLQPVGIVTDRDMVCGQIALAKDLFCLLVSDVMTPNPLVLDENSGLSEGIGALKAQGVRRAPVVDAAGNLSGIISTDDLLPAVVRELAALVKTVDMQARRHARS